MNVKIKIKSKFQLHQLSENNIQQNIICKSHIAIFV